MPIPISVVVKRKSYSKPKLIALGDLRTLTLGGSPSSGDSGGAQPGLPFKPIHQNLPNPGGFVKPGDPPYFQP